MKRAQRVRLVALTSVTIAVALVVSFSSIRQLAEYAGFGWRAWLFPILVDVVAAAGYEVWMSQSRARRPAAWLAGFAVSLSLLANVTDWWITQQTYLAAGLGAVPPVMLAWLLFVVHRHHRDATNQPPELEVAAPDPTPVGDPPVLSQEWVHEHTRPLVDPRAVRAEVERRAEVAPNGRVHQDEPARPAPAHNGSLRLVQPETNGARFSALAEPMIVAERTQVAASVHQGEEAMVHHLIEQELLHATRREVEDALTQFAGEKIGSTRATRLQAAARVQAVQS